MNYPLKSGLITLLLLGASLPAEECKFGTTYVSKELNADTWANSIETAATNPGQWEKDSPWLFSVEKNFRNYKSSLFLVAELTADETYEQTVFISGINRVRLNGVELNKVKQTTHPLYTLSLKKGLNIFEMEIMKLPEKEKNRTVTITRNTLEYIFPPASKVIEDTRLAIDFLARKYPLYKGESYLKRLDTLAKRDASVEDVNDIRYKALVLNNPEINFDKILFRKSNSGHLPANWQGNSTLLRAAGKERQPSFNDELQILNLKDLSTETIYRGKTNREGLMDICLDYSGEKFLYSGVDVESNTFQLYEMNIDGTGKRQITPFLPEIDNYNGIYLPNGKILFCSTASLNSVPCVGGNDYVGTLFEINPDGTGMKQVCFDQENDWYPWVKENGRIMYSRWEYTDNSHYFTRILLEMNPDGTANRSIYGSNSYWPNTLFYAKQIPGNTSKFSAIVSGHHGVARAGELLLFDHNKGDFEADGALQRIPGRGKKVEPEIIDMYMVGKWPRFLHPFPLSETFFLVSGQISPNERWGLYLVDTFDNMIKLGDSPNLMFEPVPIMKRNVPPEIPDRRNPDMDGGMLFIQDIYEGPGLEGMPRGTVAALRLFTYGYAYRLNGSHDALAIEGGWDTKRVLGTVPVEEDGSVMVKVPHNMPISIQPIDKDGKALQVMRSWTVAQQGEAVSCVGCHEPTRTAPPSRAAMAAKKAPQELTPWSKVGRIHGFSFKREIQPILDRYCIGCHDGSGSKPDFADTTEKRFNDKANFGKSYMALHPYVRRPGPESNLHILTPMDYHVSTSPLFQILEKGHYNVTVDDESMRQLATWADLNVPYHARWTDVNCRADTLASAKRTREYKKLYSELDDDIEWMPPMPTTRHDFVKPPKLERPKPLTLKDWPLDQNIEIEERTLPFGDQKLNFVKVPAGKFVMGSVAGAPDEWPQKIVTIEKPFLMATTEITNEQLRKFMPEHDSKTIDQQWKDHIYPGYPANEPQMPAVRVSWNQAIDFTQWLSKQTGQDITLPTEAQWEWAARAGSSEPFFVRKRLLQSYANLADKSIGLLAVTGVNPQPLPEHARGPLTDFVPRDENLDDGILVPSGTAQYDSNPWGLYDIIGNVAEWTRSSYKPYPYNEADGRNDLSSEERKVVRGGSWRDKPTFATTSCRLAYPSYQKVFNVGFRVLIEFDSEAELDAEFAKWEAASEKRVWKEKELIIMLNASFESGEEPWKIEGDCGVSTDTAQDGKYSLKLSGPKSNASQTVALEENSDYSISCWMKSDELTEGNVVFDTSDRFDGPGEGQFVAQKEKNGWTHYSGKFNSGEHANATLRIFSNNEMAGTVYVDQIEVILKK